MEEKERVITVGRTIIKVKWSTYKGKRGLDVRKWFNSRETGKLVPSRKGIWIPEDAADEVAQAINDLTGKPSWERKSVAELEAMK